MKEETRSHPCFGVVSVSRYTGRSEFFCSDLVHSGGITIMVSSAEEYTKFAKKGVYPRKTLISVDLSNSQFIDLITSAMNSTGVPCTIKSYNGESIPQIQFADDPTVIHKKHLNDINAEYIHRVDAIMNKLSDKVGEKLRKELIHDLDVLKDHLKSNSAFAEKVFQESMEKTIVEAQQSISSYIDNKITTLGLEAVKEQLEVKLIGNQ